MRGILIFTLLILTPNLALAQDFVPLVGVPGLDPNAQGSNLEGYINALYILAISIAAFLAVVKIIFSGVQYILSDVVTSKEDAKKGVKGALLGLLIVLAAVIILETINPQLTNLDVFRNATIAVDTSGTASFDLWSGFGADPASSQMTTSDGTVYGSYTTINQNDPNHDALVDAAAADCPPGSTIVKRTIPSGGDNYTRIECVFGEDGTDPNDGDVVFNNGTLTPTSNFDPDATQIGIDCSRNPISCTSFCDSNGGAYPDPNNANYCVIANPVNVAAINCQIDPNHPDCDYSTYGDTAAPTEPQPIDQASDWSVPADSTYYTSVQACQDDLVNIPGGTYCLSRRDAEGNQIYVPANAQGQAI